MRAEDVHRLVATSPRAWWSQRPGTGLIDAVVIVGSTCAGKTTLVNALRESSLHRHGLVAVPRRFITRPRRDSDCPVENGYVDEWEFDRMIECGEIDVRWTRELEAGRRVRYGFAPVPAGQFPVYSGNNAFYDCADTRRPRRALERALVVGVNAPDDVREQRLRRRSPDLWQQREGEVAHRMADRSANMLPRVHLVLENHGRWEATSVAELVRVVHGLCVPAGGAVGRGAQMP